MRLLYLPAVGFSNAKLQLFETFRHIDSAEKLIPESEKLAVIRIVMTRRTTMMNLVLGRTDENTAPEWPIGKPDMRMPKVCPAPEKDGVENIDPEDGRNVCDAEQREHQPLRWSDNKGVRSGANEIIDRMFAGECNGRQCFGAVMQLVKWPKNRVFMMQPVNPIGREVTG